MKKKIAIGIVVFFVLVLLIPIRLQLKDGGSVQYRVVLYSVTKYHQITLNADSEDACNSKVKEQRMVGVMWDVFRRISVEPNIHRRWI